MSGFGSPSMRRALQSNDLRFGLLLVSLGALGYAVSAPLPFGTAARMGPGFVPKLLAGVLIALGALGVAQAFAPSADDGSGAAAPWAVRPMLGIAAGVLFFAYAVESLGMVLTVAGTVLLGSLGDRNARRTELLLLAAAVAAGCTALFVKALGVGIPIWPGA